MCAPTRSRTSGTAASTTRSNTTSSPACPGISCERRSRSSATSAASTTSATTKPACSGPIARSSSTGTRSARRYAERPALGNDRPGFLERRCTRGGKREDAARARLFVAKLPRDEREGGRVPLTQLAPYRIACRFTVMYPTKYKQLRVALPRQARRGSHAPIGTNEGLGVLSSPGHAGGRSGGIVARLTAIV